MNIIFKNVFFKQWYNVLGNTVIRFLEWDEKIDINLMFLHVSWSWNRVSLA